jgi:CO/xanthine dehydrogenase Mo-binding subunit
VVLQVTGKSIYGEDLYRPGMLYAVALYSAHAHARIVSIDISGALEAPGVVDVITAADVPFNRYGFTHQDQPVLAEDRVRYLGDALAVVAATELKAAREAVKRIKVQYEALPSVHHPLAAMDPGATAVHGDSNVAGHFTINRGDVDRGFASADIVIEESYATPKVEHCHLEPHVALAELEPDGKVVIWSSTSRPFAYAGHLGKVLKLPMTAFQIKTPAVGGGFGGKNRIVMEPWVALLAMRTGRPVKMTYTREEEFFASTVRHGYTMEYRTGLMKDGAIVARQVKIISDSGAYADQGETTLKKAAVHAAGPYNIPNIRVEAYLVYTNNIVGGAMRGFGVPQVCFACESHMDSLAARIGMDPAQFRLKNLFGEEAVIATGQRISSGPMRRTLEKALATAGPLEESSPGKRKGRGMACMFYPSGSTAQANPTAGVIKVSHDGTATVFVGAVDEGQGSNTVLAQIVAEELGIPFESVRMVTADTELTPYDAGTGASRVTYVAGNALKKAAARARAILAEAAAQLLGVDDTALITARNGRVFLSSDPGRFVEVAQAAWHSERVMGRPVVVTDSYNPSTTDFEEITGSGTPFEAYNFATQVADVEVDTETGEVDMNRVVAVHDCGRAINPMLVEGQVQGGVVMGMGYALTEEIWEERESGRVLNDSFTDYLVPIAANTPGRIDVVMLEEEVAKGPFGAKGVGEPTTLPTAPAVTNAIFAAVGVRIYDLPANPEKVLANLRARHKDD